jgi:hypothetical protein
MSRRVEIERALVVSVQVTRMPPMRPVSSRRGL